MEPSADVYFREGWHRRDQRNNGLEIMRKPGVVDDLDIMSVDRIKKHPYYQEFLAPHRLRWFAGVKLACAEDMWCLSIQRTIDQEPFTAQEKQQLTTLSTRLSASVALARTLGAAASTGLLEAFEISGTAAILINRLGKAFKLNQTAERVLATLEQVTDSLAIAKETGRSRLKSIFVKLGVNRQAELVAVLSSLLGRK
jgi:DNA-binding CsgD family transcriptional regulator